MRTIKFRAMEKTRLLEILKSEPNDVDAIGMILSNYTDYGHSEMGGMVSVKQFTKVAECLLEWWEGKETHDESSGLNKPVVISSFVCGHPPKQTYLNDGIWHCEKCGGKWNSIANK